MAPAIDATHLLPKDLAYDGAFRLPSEFDWGARGLSYYPLGDKGSGSLLVIGFDLNKAEFAQVSIPQPVVTSNWMNLPEAMMLSRMTRFDGGDLVESIDPDCAFASGIQYLPKQGSQTSDKLYGSVDFWYGVVDESHPTI